MKATLDPQTLNLKLPVSGRLTQQQWRDIEWPPCPKCGTTVQVDRIDVTQLGDPPYLRYYIPGRWACPNDCDPRVEHLEDARD